MAKARTRYICSDCGTSSTQWVGKCPGCKAWNTLKGETITDTGKRSHRYSNSSNQGGVLTAKARPLAEVSIEDILRLSSGEAELDRVLGNLPENA